jgi:hypothetical protein
MTDQERILEQALGPAVWARQGVLAAYLFNYYQGVVAAGPFQGLRLLPDVSWGVGDNGAKMVGLYEAELHEAVAALEPPPLVINIGCAEGYYAVGLARRFPHAAVYAFDTDLKAQLICRRTAALNEVGDRVTVLGACTPEMLVGLLRTHPTALLVIDCEGDETTLLAGDVLAEARRAALIVECHDFLDPTITPTLTERLGASHDVAVIQEGARDPNQLEPLRKMSSLDRWLVVLENRPATMNWIVAQPRP